MFNDEAILRLEFISVTSANTRLQIRTSSAEHIHPPSSPISQLNTKNTKPTHLKPNTVNLTYLSPVNQSLSSYLHTTPYILQTRTSYKKDSKMSQTAEFIFFKLKPTVKPEGPNDEGNELLELFNATKQQSGYHSSAWGRTVEDESVVAWVIVWTDARGASHSAQLTPFLEPNTSATTLYTTLVPSLTDTETLTTNPVTELVALSFPTSLNPDEHSALNQNLIDFRTALTEKLEEGKRPVSWSMGHVDRPGGVEHTASPSGRAFVQFLAVGWESVETHMAVRETKEFTETIQPIREKALSPVEGLKMKHVSFKKI